MTTDIKSHKIHNNSCNLGKWTIMIGQLQTYQSVRAITDVWNSTRKNLCILYILKPLTSEKFGNQKKSNARWRGPKTFLLHFFNYNLVGKEIIIWLLNCQQKKSKPINSIWLLNRVPIELNHGILIEKRGKRISALTIDALKKHHIEEITQVRMVFLLQQQVFLLT